MSACQKTLILLLVSVVAACAIKPVRRPATQLDPQIQPAKPDPHSCTTLLHQALESGAQAHPLDDTLRDFWFDEELKRLEQRVRAILPGAHLKYDGQRFVVTPQNPGDEIYVKVRVTSGESISAYQRGFRGENCSDHRFEEDFIEIEMIAVSSAGRTQAETSSTEAFVSKSIDPLRGKGLGSLLMNAVVILADWYGINHIFGKLNFTNDLEFNRAFEQSGDVGRAVDATTTRKALKNLGFEFEPDLSYIDPESGDFPRVVSSRKSPIHGTPTDTLLTHSVAPRIREISKFLGRYLRKSERDELMDCEPSLPPETKRERLGKAGFSNGEIERLLKRQKL